MSNTFKDGIHIGLFVFFLSLLILYFLSIYNINLLKILFDNSNGREPYENGTSSTSQIIVSMTTSPKRIPYIHSLLDTLENQTVKPHKIVLNLPYVFKRTNTTFDIIPDFITNNPLVHVNRCEDIGPATKILPTVKLFKDPSTILISIDDDIEYRENFIETLLKYHQMSPDAVITGESYMRLPNKENVIYAELVEGYSAVLYQKRHLENFDIEELKQYPKECYFADDFILSNYLKKNQIDIVVANEPAGNKTTKNIYLDYGNGEDALRNGADGNTNGNIENYEKCSRYLDSKGELYIHYYQPR